MNNFLQKLDLVLLGIFLFILLGVINFYRWFKK